MTHTHTPAPWHDSGHDGKENLIIESDYGSICSIWRVNGYKCQVADARLIAAAPELLAHLKMLVLGISEGIDIPKDGAAITAAREAIAKAEGNA